MRVALFFATILAMTVPSIALAGPSWLPVCHDVDQTVEGIVTVHASPDCGPDAWVEACPPPPSTLPCGRLDVPPPLP